MIPWSLLLWSCSPAPSPLSQPPPPARLSQQGCPDLEVVGRHRVGGDVVAATSDGIGRLFVATTDSVQVHRLDAPEAEPSLIHPPGEVQDLVYAAGYLWIAAGTEGLLRWRLGSRLPEPVWSSEGELVDLAASGGVLWAADRAGRVAALDLQLGSDPRPSVLEVDGWPGQVVPWADGVLVDLGQGQLVAVRGGPNEPLESAEAPELPATGSLCSRDQLAYGANLNVVHRVSRDGQTAHDALPFDILAMSATREGVVIVGDGGLVRGWGHEDPDALPWLTEGKLPFSATGVDVVDDVAVFFSADEVAWARRTTDGWSVDAKTRSTRGNIHALAMGEARLALGTARADGRGAVWLADRGPRGTLRSWHSLDTPAVADLVWVGEDLLVAPQGDGLLQLEAGETDLRPAGLAARSVLALQPYGSNGVLALLERGAIHWLERDWRGEWKTVAETRLADLSPVDLIVHQDRVVVSVAEVGAVVLLSGPGEPAELLPLGAAVDLPGPDCPCTGRLASDGDRVWASSPLGGLLVFDPGATSVAARLPLHGGAWQAAPWGEELVVATGHAGLARVDPERLLSDPSMEGVVRSCDLPGRTRRLVVDGEQLHVSTGGSLISLRRAGPADQPSR